MIHWSLTVAHTTIATNKSYILLINYLAILSIPQQRQTTIVNLNLILDWTSYLLASCRQRCDAFILVGIYLNYCQSYSNDDDVKGGVSGSRGSHTPIQPSSQPANQTRQCKNQTTISSVNLRQLRVEFHVATTITSRGRGTTHKCFVSVVIVSKILD